MLHESKKKKNFSQNILVISFIIPSILWNKQLTFITRFPPKYTMATFDNR